MKWCSGWFPSIRPVDFWLGAGDVHFRWYGHGMSGAASCEMLRRNVKTIEWLVCTTRCGNGVEPICLAMLPSIAMRWHLLRNQQRKEMKCLALSVCRAECRSQWMFQDGRGKMKVWCHGHPCVGRSMRWTLLPDKRMTHFHFTLKDGDKLIFRSGRFHWIHTSSRRYSRSH